MNDKTFLIGAWLGRLNHLNFGGIIYGTADSLRCCQLSWTVSVVNW